MSKKEIVIIGIGRFSLALIDKFKNMPKYSIVAIDINKKRLEKITGVKNLIVGDATNDEWLISIGIENADFYVIGMGSDFQTSAIIAANLNENFTGVVIAKSVNEQHEMILRKMGIDNVVTPEITAAKITFNKIVNPLALENNQTYEVIEISEGVSIATVPIISKWLNKSVKDISLPNHLGFALVYEDEVKASVVTGKTVLKDGDLVALIGENKVLLSTLEKIKKEIIDIKKEVSQSENTDEQKIKSLNKIIAKQQDQYKALEKEKEIADRRAQLLKEMEELEKLKI